MRETLELSKSGQLAREALRNQSIQILACGTWIGELDFVFELLFSDSRYLGGAFPTEIIFINMFKPDGSALRQDPRFRNLVVETGLLDYWRQWGWSDYCEADGDSFRCN
jgi:hypothetical protein